MDLAPPINGAVATQDGVVADQSVTATTAPNAPPPLPPRRATSSAAATTSQPATTVDHPSTAPAVEGPTAEQVHPSAQAPTASMDPNKPSSESAPTALPTNPATHPAEQKRAAEKEHPKVIKREVEKTKAAEREIKGESPLGTVVTGLEDDRLWTMLRRFDVQVKHVLHPATNVPKTEPDLRPSHLPNLPSHSETLRSNLERVFAAIGPSSIRGVREAQRLMSWSPQERWRTGTYCVAYFTCWVFGYALMGMAIFAVVMICFPVTRRYLFPPVPPAPFTPPSATDPTNQKGDESLIGNVDSPTVHRSKAEQAEEQAFEATTLVQAFATRLVFDGGKKGKNAGNAQVGEKQQAVSESSDDEDVVPTTPPPAKDPYAHELIKMEGDQSQGLESADVVIGGKKITADTELNEKEKKKLAQTEAKRKRDELVSKMTKATEDGLGAFADMMEVMTNAMSPPAAYPDPLARFKIAGAFVVPPALALTFTPAWVFGRAATFMFGVGFFGQPLLIKAAKKCVELVPNWQELLDLRNSILSGVPTDAQLTLHLLRVGEALNHPLPRPPPPPLKGTPKEAIKDTTPATITADDDAELREAEDEGGAAKAATQAKVKTKSHILGAVRSIGKRMAGFHGDVSVDGARKSIGNRVDQLVFRGLVKDHGTPQSYPAKLDGTSGRIIIEGRNELLAESQISFVPLTGKQPKFVRPINDIVEIKKAHVTMPRMALGWASGADVEGLGLTLRFKDSAQQLVEANGGESVDGETLHFKRVGRREQLFVRLVSMGRQRWETL